jgi:diaminohydroxyphosphoribosylaminopyrimidine deaminase/5-amino-6-(5-phosphoribosylamino)uracil reductase
MVSQRKIAEPFYFKTNDRMNPQDYMTLALELAARGKGFTSPNPMVGAVVVNDGKIVGKGWHEKAGAPHAEVNAIDDAGHKAADATIYVTLEPCNHHGRTPPCTEKILAAGIRHVVMAMTDPNPDVSGGGAKYLIRNGVSVTTGICEDAARRLNEAFIKYITTKRPFVTLKTAATLDGRIATRTGDSKWVTGTAARRYVHELRHANDAIMVGVNTVKADDPSLTTRLEDKSGKDPVRIVLDTRLSIPENSKLLKIPAGADTFIMTGNSGMSPNRAAIEKAGARVIDAALGNDGRIDLNALMDQLGKMEITSLLIEGGAQVAASALKANIVDKIAFFYAPKILGGDDGTPMCGGKGPALMANSIPVKNLRIRRFDDDVMMEGYL